MISWMNGLESDFNGEAGDGTGNTPKLSILEEFIAILRNFFLKIVNIFQRILGL
jgi:hypothetical protein